MSKETDTDALPRWLWLVAPLVFVTVLFVLAQAAPQFYERWLNDNEALGLLSHVQVALPLIAAVIAVRTMNFEMLRTAPWLFAWLALAALGGIYVAGEEASWGQHYIGWVTPDGWSALNDQGETNLHNISSWFDQKPRQILEAGVIIGGIIIPIYAYFRPAVRQQRFAIILPPAICLPTALLAEFAMATERAAEMWGRDVYVFSRASEVQEAGFYFFILLYLLVLRRRVRAGGYQDAVRNSADSARTIGS